MVDEIGYLPVTQDGAALFFQLINARHERASTVLTSNKSFEEEGVVGDEVMALPSSTDCCTTATSSTLAATATGCASTGKYSAKHLNRYVQEFAGRHNVRLMDTIDQMSFITRGLFGKLLTYEDLTK